MDVLIAGDRGIEVRKLQNLLNSRLVPSPGLEVDGIFGTSTHSAVVQFQKSRNLVQDGVVGLKTWQSLEQALPATAATATASEQPIWLKIAQAEAGTHENALPGQHNQKILEYHQTTTLKATTDETPWCSSFVNWVMIKAGYQGTNSAAAKSWLNWGIELDTPRQGAITVIKRRNKNSDAATGSASGYHVAFLSSVTPTHIRLLGGNQADQVRYSNFLLRSYEVKGYRWPLEVQ